MFGKKLNILDSKLNSPESCSSIWKTINSGKEWRGEFCNERKDGTTYWESNLLSPVKDSNSKIIGFIVIKEDITAKKSIEKKLKLYATTDEMTGTLNRRTGLEFLNNLIKNEENYMVVGFIDVNGLKEINDTLGHSFGDDLIISCVNIFNKNLSKNDKLCRLGGDEFLIILPYCTLDKAEELWSRIIKDFEKINLEENKDFIISVSHGFFEYSVDTQISIDNLISIADKKMYEEKKFIKEKLKSTIK
jgi:diguanylate cyclase (GGDEF)-like protein